MRLFDNFGKNASRFFLLSGIGFLLLAPCSFFSSIIFSVFLELFFNTYQFNETIASIVATAVITFIFISIFFFALSLFAFIFNKLSNKTGEISDTQPVNVSASPSPIEYAPVDEDKSLFIQHADNVSKTNAIKKKSRGIRISSRDDLQDAINRTWTNYLAIFGMVKYIENILTHGEVVLYVTIAKITAGQMAGSKMVYYDFNENIYGILIITNYHAWHFSRRKGIGITPEVMAFDASSLMVRKHLFSSYIHLQSDFGISAMNIMGLNNKDFKMVVNLIQYSINKQKGELQNRKR